MGREKDGCKWTKKDEQILTDMFWSGRSYDEMAKRLQRTWFACKCRLIKLQLIPYNPDVTDMSLIKSVEKYDVPLRHSAKTGQCATQEEVDNFINTNEEDTSRTFSTTELNIVQDYLKSRLARLAVQKLGASIYVKQLEIARLEEIFTNEISKIEMAKNMPVFERERQLVRIA